MSDGKLAFALLPSEDDEVLPGVRWGKIGNLFTSAYWKCRLLLAQNMQSFSHFKLGRNLREETAVCLLGGFGMTAELGLAAFQRIQRMGLLNSTDPKEREFFRALSEPLTVGGRKVRYRYPRQRAKFLFLAMKRFSSCTAPNDDLALRDWLLTFTGIGLKTASWIVRNYKASNSVAIIDVHILRAGILAGIFQPWFTPEKQYLDMEARFLAWASAMKMPPSLLDTVIWREMRQFGRAIPTGLIG